MPVLHPRIAAAVAAFASCLLAASPASGTGATVTLDGSVEHGDNSCNTVNFMDTGNTGRVALDWACAEAIGLGTINDGGTPGDEDDDTFDPTDDPTDPNDGPNTPDASANNGSLTFWIFRDVEVCVEDSMGNECCLTSSVRVVKNTMGNNDVFRHDVTISAGWIDDVNTCSTGAGRNLIMRWSDNGPWALQEPAAPSEDQPDEATGDAKRVFPATASGLDGTSIDFHVLYSSASNWTILPQSVADAIGLAATEEIDLTGTATLRGLIGANMNSTGQTVFPVAELPALQLPIGPVQSGPVLISDDANSSFGVLGGAFMDPFSHGRDDFTGNDVLGSGIIDVAACPADLDGNHTVGVPDLLELLAAWGDCHDDKPCPADLDGNGIVGVPDLLELLAAWGTCPACPGTGDCCIANDTPGCNNAVCCQLVCDHDPACCELAWDVNCAAIAIDACGEMCTVACPGEGDCCLPNDTPGCSQVGCCEIVCADDPFCCEQQWDAACAADAGDRCGDLCPDAPLGRCCFIGFAGPICQVLTKAECMAIPSFQSWTIGEDCADGPAACEGPLLGQCCFEGFAGPICMMLTKEECFAQTFPLSFDPDGTCEHGQVTCSIEIACPGEGDCCLAHDTPGCNDPGCCETVCIADPTCCTSAWDDVCAELALAMCECVLP